jgi:hypothetical protein
MCILKFAKHQLKKLRITQINGTISCVHELQRLILMLKCPYSPK